MNHLTGSRGHTSSRLGPFILATLGILGVATFAGGVGVVYASGFTVSGTVGSGMCAVNGGTWNATTSTCKIGVSWTIAPKTVLVVPTKVILTVASSGSINVIGRLAVRNGTLTNLAGGSISSNGTINNNGGTIKNNGTITNQKFGGINFMKRSWLYNYKAGVISNFAFIGANNRAIMRNWGIITNQPGSHFDNDNHAFLWNAGIFTLLSTSRSSGENHVVIVNVVGGTINDNGTLVIHNHGILVNNGTLSIQSGGKLRNDDHGSFTNYGTVSNSGDFKDRNHGVVLNHGIISTSGTWGTENHGTFTNFASASVNNSGTLTIRNHAVLNNFGKVFNLKSGVIINGLPQGFISNNAGATIYNYGLIKNRSIINNAGTIHNTSLGGKIMPAGTINNTGTID